MERKQVEALAKRVEAAAKEAERKDGGAAVMASHRIFQRLLPLLLIEYAWGIAQDV